MCGLRTNWGRSTDMALMLDHINGVANDHRLENLRIVCPNCAATLETHCGRKNQPRESSLRACLHVEPICAAVHPTSVLLAECWGTVLSNRPRRAQPSRRKVSRPSYEQLMQDVRTMSFLAIGRKYGVSDNAVRKWIRWYEHATSADEGEEAA